MFYNYTSFNYLNLSILDRSVGSAKRPCCIIVARPLHFPAALQAAKVILSSNPGRCPRAVATILLSAGKPLQYMLLPWPERPKLQQPVGNAPGSGRKFARQPEGLQERRRATRNYATTPFSTPDASRKGSL